MHFERQVLKKNRVLLKTARGGEIFSANQFICLHPHLQSKYVKVNRK